MARIAAHWRWSARSASCPSANSEVTETRAPDRDTLDHLRGEGLIRTIALDEHDQAVVLTDGGRDLLDANRNGTILQVLGAVREG